MRYALLAVLLLVPAATAQGLTEDTSTLYLIRGESDYAATADASNHGQGGFWGSAVGGVVGSPYAGDGREWVFPFVDPLNHAIMLDGNGSITASIWIGGGANEAGQHEVGWQLLNGGTTIAEGEPQQVTFSAAAPQHELTWEVAPATATIENTTLSVRVYSQNGQGSGIRIGLGDGQGGGMRSQLGLPVIAAAATDAPPAGDETPDQESPMALPLAALAAAMVIGRRMRG